MSWQTLADRAIRGERPTRDEARAVLRASDDELLSILDAAYRVRRTFHGKKVRLHVLQNAKSGACPEDCRFCSQSSFYETPAGEYPIQTVDEIVAGARRAKAAKAWKYCIVTATRGPSRRDLDVVCEAVEQIKAELDLTICTSLGVLDQAKAERLKAAGVDRYNHNLETSERYYGEVVTTHSWKDRVDTVKHARAAGMEACCGGIVGMGETEDDVLDLAFALAELEVESVPVNFLDPRPGTPLATLRSGASAPLAGDPREPPRMTPSACLKALCMFRFLHPRADLRVAGGREVNLRWMQPMALYVVNSIFTQGYLTTGGAAASDDHRMILDLGFTIEEVPTDEREQRRRPHGPDQLGLHADG